MPCKRLMSLTRLWLQRSGVQPCAQRDPGWPKELQTAVNMVWVSCPYHTTIGASRCFSRITGSVRLLLTLEVCWWLSHFHVPARITRRALISTATRSSGVWVGDWRLPYSISIACSTLIAILRQLRESSNSLSDDIFLGSALGDVAV